MTMILKLTNPEETFESLTFVKEAQYSLADFNLPPDIAEKIDHWMDHRDKFSLILLGNSKCGKTGLSYHPRINVAHGLEQHH